MDIASSPVFQHAHRIERLVAAVVLVWLAVLLLALLAGAVMGSDPVTSADPPQVGPIRWVRAAYA